MKPRLKQLWKWTPEWQPEAPGVTAVAQCGSLLLALDRDTCVAAVDLTAEQRKVLWSHPDPPGTYVDVDWALGGADGPLFVSVKMGEFTRAIRCRRPRRRFLVVGA
jgi:hypothetical protein